MAKQKQTVGKRIAKDYTALEYVSRIRLARRIDRAIKAAEKRGYERGRMEAK